MSTTSAVVVALGLIIAAGILVNGALMVVRMTQHKGKGYQDLDIHSGDVEEDEHTAQLS